MSATHTVTVKLDQTDVDRIADYLDNGNGDIDDILMLITTQTHEREGK